MIKYHPAYKTPAGKNAVLKIYDEILARWPVPYKELCLDTLCGKTFIIQCGDQTLPPLILLHGTSSNSSMWIGDVAEFTKHYCVYALDIPGEPGKSGEKQYPLKSPFYREWLDEVMQKLQLSKASLMGISLGAWLALSFSVSHSEKVEKLVLLCPSGIGPQKVTFMFKAIPLMLLGEKGLDRISLLVAGDQPILEEALTYTKLIARNFNLRRESVPIFTDEELKKITVPLILFAGKKDVMLHSVKTIKRMESLLPQAQLYLLPDHGHILIGLTDKILDFLTDTPQTHI